MNIYCPPFSRPPPTFLCHTQCYWHVESGGRATRSAAPAAAAAGALVPPTQPVSCICWDSFVVTSPVLLAQWMDLGLFPSHWHQSVDEKAPFSKTARLFIFNLTLSLSHKHDLETTLLRSLYFWYLRPGVAVVDIFAGVAERLYSFWVSVYFTHC